MPDNIQKGAPQCGLYLILPDNWAESGFLTQLKGMFRAINASPYEKNAHVVEFRLSQPPQTKEDLEIIHAMCELTKSQGVVFMMGSDIDLAKTIGADGVLLDKLDDVAQARDAMGDDAIIGFRSGTSRLKAEKALENGADFVSFFDGVGGYIDPSIVQWWKMKTDNSCLVEGSINANDCGFYVDAGADFIDSSSYVFNHPDGIMQGIVNMMDAIHENVIGNKREYH